MFIEMFQMKYIEFNFDDLDTMIQSFSKPVDNLLKGEQLQVNCPRCNASLIDEKGGGVLVKCWKCSLDGDLGFDMSYMKNEYEIEAEDGDLIAEFSDLSEKT